MPAEEQFGKRYEYQALAELDRAVFVQKVNALEASGYTMQFYLLEGVTFVCVMVRRTG